MKRTLLRRFLDASLRTKYLTAVLLLLIATALSSSYLLSRNVQAAYQVFYQDAMSDMTDIYDQVSRFEKRMTHLSTIVQNNQTALDLLRDVQNLDLQSFEPVRQKITPILFALLDGSGDYDCRLYVRAKNDFIDSTARILLLPDPAKEGWVQTAMQGWGWRSFYSPRELGAASPALLAPVRDAEHVQDLIGLLRIDISPDALRRMMTPVRSGSWKRPAAMSWRRAAFLWIPLITSPAFPNRNGPVFTRTSCMRQTESLKPCSISASRFPAG